MIARSSIVNAQLWPHNMASLAPAALAGRIKSKGAYSPPSRSAWCCGVCLFGAVVAGSGHGNFTLIFFHHPLSSSLSPSLPLSPPSRNHITIIKHVDGKVRPSSCM